MPSTSKARSNTINRVVTHMEAEDAFPAEVIPAVVEEAIPVAAVAIREAAVAATREAEDGAAATRATSMARRYFNR
jgi:hypothetical protein